MSDIGKVFEKTLKPLAIRLSSLHGDWGPDGDAGDPPRAAVQPSGLSSRTEVLQVYSRHSQPYSTRSLLEETELRCQQMVLDLNQHCNKLEVV